MATVSTSAYNQVREFDDVVRRFSTQLFSIAYSILRNRAEAEDAVQETMFKAWRKWDHLRDPQLRVAWLTRICVNQCLSQRRQQRPWWPFSGEIVAPVSAIDSEDLDLDRAFADLSLRQRAVLILHYQYGYTLDECAAILHCGRGTARTHYSLALTSLRRTLAYE